MAIEEILALAKASFGLVIPDTLKNNQTFFAFDLNEDALLRVDVVDEATKTIIFSSYDGTVYEMGAEELVEFPELATQWRMLVPTVVPEKKPVVDTTQPFWVELSVAWFGKNPLDIRHVDLNQLDAEAVGSWLSELPDGELGNIDAFQKWLSEAAVRLNEGHVLLYSFDRELEITLKAAPWYSEEDQGVYVHVLRDLQVRYVVHLNNPTELLTLKHNPLFLQKDGEAILAAIEYPSTLEHTECVMDVGERLGYLAAALYSNTKHPNRPTVSFAEKGQLLNHASGLGFLLSKQQLDVGTVVDKQHYGEIY